jgi:hypothetical protein
MFWKVRATPAAQMRYGLSPPISRPSRRSEPSLGA